MKHQPNPLFSLPARWWRALRQQRQKDALLYARVVALLFLAMLIDEEAIWWMAHLRLVEPLGRFNGFLLEGGLWGLSDLMLLILLAVGVVAGGLRLSGKTPPPALNPFLTGAAFILGAGLLFQLLLARPAPWETLSGLSPYQPWFLPGDVSRMMWPMGSSPAIGIALIFYLIFPLQTVAISLNLRFIGGALVLALATLSTLNGLYSQVFWPSDAALGLGLGLMAGRLFFPAIPLSPEGKKTGAGQSRRWLLSGLLIGSLLVSFRLGISLLTG